MTGKTKTTTTDADDQDPHFTAFVQRTTPEPLRDTPGRLGQLARQLHRAQCARDWLLMLANGHRPHEVASGRLDPGALVSAAGVVSRPPTPTISADLQTAAVTALRDLNQLGISIDPVFMPTLQQAAWGRWQGPASTVAGAVAEAERAVSDKRRDLQQAAHDRQAQPQIVVHRTFTTVGGVTYAPGTYPLTDDQLADLEGWRDKMEAMAQRRGWSHPEGSYNDSVWPPYSVVSQPEPVGAGRGATGAG